MTLDPIVKLINEEEAMSDTINTDHKDFVGSEDERCFKLHQANIMDLKKIYGEYTTMRTALRQIRDTACISGDSFNSIAVMAQTALVATNKPMVP